MENRGVMLLRSGLPGRFGKVEQRVEAAGEQVVGTAGELADLMSSAERRGREAVEDTSRGCRPGMKPASPVQMALRLLVSRPEHNRSQRCEVL